MATLQKIRNKAGVLIAIVIGIALLSFVLSDFLTSGSTLFRDTDTTILEVDGQKVPYEVFESKVNKLVENYKLSAGPDAELTETVMDGLREQAWEELVEEAIMYKEYEILGLSVSDEELYDMVAGENVNPQIQQIFVNQETGQFDQALVNQFINALKEGQATEEQRAWWLNVEQILIKTRITEKYNNLIKKGLNIPTEQAKLESKERNYKVTFSYISQLYSDISDSSIVITDSDISAYYEAHKAEFESEASRDVEYITFDVLPSERDYKVAEEWINGIVEDFKTSDNDPQFVNLNADTPFEDIYYKKGELPVLIDSIMFLADTGFVYGPFFENETYKLVKLTKIDFMPDSVHARHILIQPSETMTYDKAKTFADSLKKEIEKGMPFEIAAKMHSADKSNSDKGGDLNWFKQGMMVKPFNDTCFFSNKGDIKLIETQFGVHIVEILDQSESSKKIQIATIDRFVEPSTATYQEKYAEASKFIDENNTFEKFNEAIANNPALNKRIATNLKETDKNIPGLDNPRELVRWAYKAQKEELSSIFEMGQRFVIASLTEIREEGIAPLDQVKTEIETILLKDKKAEQLIAKLNGFISGSSNIDAVSAKMSLAFQIADNVSFSASMIPGMGAEPQVIAVAVNSEKNKLSKPIKGENGVYIIQVNETQTVEESDYLTEQIRSEGTLRSKVDYQVFQSLRESVELKDLRAKFF